MQKTFSVDIKNKTDLKKIISGAGVQNNCRLLLISRYALLTFMQNFFAFASSLLFDASSKKISRADFVFCTGYFLMKVRGAAALKNISLFLPSACRAEHTEAELLDGNHRLRRDRFNLCATDAQIHPIECPGIRGIDFGHLGDALLRDDQIA